MTDTDTTVQWRGSAAILPALVAGIRWTVQFGGFGMPMSMWEMTRFSPAPPVSIDTDLWGLGHFLRIVLMWWIMMLAMMMLPLVVKFGRHARHETLGEITRFLSGYSLVWLGFSVIAALVQQGLELAGLFHPMMMWSISPPLFVALFVAAGLYQFSPAKARSRQACKTVTFDAGNGLIYGLACLKSSAPLMLLFFAVGVMNGVAMVVLALIILVERCFSVDRRFDLSLGFVLIGLGLVAL